MPNQTSRFRFYVVGAFTALSVGALTAPGALAQTGAAAKTSPLSSAKTIQVKEAFFVLGKTGLRPYYSLVVQVKRPGNVRIDATPVAAPDKKPSKPSFYLSDGTVQHEYRGSSNKYINSKAPAPGEHANASLSAIAQIDLLLSPGQAPDPKDGITRTVSTETLDGKAVTVTTDTQPTRKTSKGSSYTLFEKLWTDAQTGLPYRWEYCVTEGGKTTTEEQLNFSDWALNRPVSATLFAWTPPAGSTEYIAPKLLAVGTPAPDFAAVTPAGKTIHLSDYKGKPIVLDFWATWCGPCQQSMPHLEKVYQQIKNKGVSVLGVCVWDDKAEYDKWVIAKKTTYTFQTAFDPAGRGDDSIAGKLYGVSGIPTQYIIDKDGKVVAALVGYEDGDVQLEVALNKLGVDIAVPKKTASSR